MEVYYIYPTLTMKVTMAYENKFKDMKHFNNKSFYLIHRISSGTKNITFSFMNKKKNENVNTTYEIDNLFLHLLASSFTALMFYDYFCLLLVFTHLNTKCVKTRSKQKECLPFNQGYQTIVFIYL